jgi:hypothetical protein
MTLDPGKPLAQSAAPILHLRETVEQADKLESDRKVQKHDLGRWQG